MLRRVDFVRTDVSMKRSASITTIRIGELGTTLSVTKPTHATKKFEIQTYTYKYTLCISSQRASVASYS
jgi:hypothetical protein